MMDFDKSNETAARPEVNNSILAEAHNIIYGDREKTYGHPRINLDRIADFWTTYLSEKHPASAVKITAEDVCYMMILLKVARLRNDPSHRDSLVDLAGYAALVERIANYPTAAPIGTTK